MVTAKDEPESIIQHPKTKGKSSSQTVSKGIRDATWDDASVMQAWTAVLNDGTENIEEIEMLDDDPKLYNEMEDPLDAFVRPCDVIKMIADKTKRATAVMVTEFTTDNVKDSIEEYIKVWYRSAKEGIKPLIFHLVEENINDVVGLGRLNMAFDRKRGWPSWLKPLHGWTCTANGNEQRSD